MSELEWYPNTKATGYVYEVQERWGGGSWVPHHNNTVKMGTPGSIPPSIDVAGHVASLFGYFSYEQAYAVKWFLLANAVADPEAPMDYDAKVVTYKYRLDAGISMEPENE